MTNVLFQFNSLLPSDAKWRHRFGSTLVQVMACCLTAPSHYLNQYWLVICKVQWHSFEGNFTREIPQPSITKIGLKITHPKFHLNLPGANELISKYSNKIHNAESVDIPSSMVTLTLPQGISNQGLYSISNKTLYDEISWNLKVPRLGVIMIVSFWILANILRSTAAKMPRCQISEGSDHF